MADIEITLDDFADAVEEQNNLMKEVLTSSHPAAEFLRSMFDGDFLEQKVAETEEYIAQLREEAEDEEDATG